MITTRYAHQQAKRLFKLCQMNDRLDEDRVRQVVRYLAKTARRSSPRVLASFIRLIRLDRRQRTVSVESATPLPASVQEEIRAALGHSGGPAVTTTFAQRDSLIGGVRIQAGWNVYDGSIAAKLERLARTF